MVEIGDDVLYDMRKAVRKHDFREGTISAILVPVSIFNDLQELLEGRDRRMGIPPEVYTGNLFFMSIPVEKYHDMVDAARKIEELLTSNVDVLYCERKLPACGPHILPEED